MASLWFDWACERLGGWPSSYLAIDVETSGLDAAKDVILEWGYCRVENGRTVEQRSTFLDWRNHAVVPFWYIQQRVSRLAQEFAEAGKPYTRTLARLNAEGLPADAVLREMDRVLSDAHKTNTVMVAHNGTFDERMIAANLAGFRISAGFSFRPNGWVDTAAAEKASQISIPPRNDESLNSYWRRVSSVRAKGIKSSLDTHCFQKYGFDTNYGLSKANMHSAGMDAYCCHLLMEEFRKLGRGKPKASPANPPVIFGAPQVRPTVPPPPVRYRKQRMI